MENQGTKWRMNLQLFAEDAPDNAEDESQENGGKGGNGGAAQTYTAEEVMKLIQSEADKRVNQALAKQKREYEKKLSLSNLGEQERAIAEKDEEISGLKDQIAELTQFRTRHSVMTELSARGLDPTLADVIALTDDEAEMKSRLDTFETAYRAAQEKDFKTRIAGKPPEKGNPPSMTREDFRKLPLAKQQELYQTDPDTYKKMTEG